ncbi:MAG: pimeloyl-ACP methyl ester esterase BioH [Burkholderiales bacterium]
MSLHCEVAGSGPDLVLLHGWGMNAGIWSGVVRELAPHFRVHAVDLPGYGASAACEPYTLEHLAQRLAQRLPSPCLVCGWSLGGQLALTWAGARPQQVRRLALIATTPCFVRRDGWTHAVEAGVLRAFAQALTTDYAGTLRRFVALQAQGDDRARQVIAQLRQTLFARGEPASRVLTQGLDILLGTDLRAQLAAIAQPALVLHGECDALVPSAAGAHLGRMLPRARFVGMPGAAHAPFASDPMATSALLKRFFDER